MKEIYFLLLLSTQLLYGQVNPTDSLHVMRAVYTAKQHYVQAIAGNSKAYSGTEYVSPWKDKKVIGDPYYLDYDWQPGSVLYSGHWYDNVPLRYDMADDQLHIEYAQGYESIILNLERITRFQLNNHTFVRLASSPGENIIQAGFYDLLYDGNIKVYVKRYKLIREIMDQQVMKVEYIEKNRFVLNKEGKYFVITKKKDLWSVFPAHKSSIKKGLAAERISFTTDPEKALVVIAESFDQWGK